VCGECTVGGGGGTVGKEESVMVQVKDNEEQAQRWPQGQAGGESLVSDSVCPEGRADKTHC
jgi:hypothetical protein